MTITPATSAAPLNAAQLVPVLQQLSDTLSSLVQVLAAQGSANGGGPASTGAAQAGAANVAAGGGGACGAGCSGAGGGAGAAPIAAATGAAALGAPPADIGGSGAGGAHDHSGHSHGAGGAPKAAAATGGGGSSKGQQAVELARKELGKPYQWGAEGPDRFDCSGLTSFIMKQLGIDIPRVSKDQAKAGTEVPRDQLQPGDLVFFDAKGSGIHHVGIYVGNGKMIHAPKTGDVVKEVSIESGYYNDAFVTARRFT